MPENSGSLQEQQENEVAWCLLLVDRVLPLVLPPEDLLNPCLDVLVSEVFSEMIFHNGVCGKACEPWLLWDGIAKALQSIRPGNRGPLKVHGSAANSLEESGLLSTARASKPTDHHKSLRGRFDTATQLFWMTIQCVMTLWFLLRAFGMALIQARSIPPRANRVLHRRKALNTPTGSLDDSKLLPKQELERRPVISTSIWSLVSELLMLDKRMPWLTGMFSFLQWTALYGPGQLCRTNSTLDR